MGAFGNGVVASPPPRGACKPVNMESKTECVMISPLPTPSPPTQGARTMEGPRGEGGGGRTGRG
eukprot:10092096-Karenia_brevis.AAC.1